MNAKRIRCLVLAALALCAVTAGCQSPGAGGDSKLSGSAEDVLNLVLDGIDASLPEDQKMPMSFSQPVTADDSQYTIGLSPDDFDKYVSEAVSSMATIGTHAHQIILIKAKSVQDAAEVKKLITSDGGYDPKKWVCVYPKKGVAVDSGSYVLLIAGEAAVADAGVGVFKNEAGSAGDVITFWEFTG
ncbi:MAG: DUF4358 domain-containing protein [Oscillospiraceae bacterium]|nr:DUF4358 domain-containing protein [Oscillospiraceae bacterium]